ncbi:response regulator [Luteolibacter yonseiensis]|uniref:histidine kinase n=1 Tax=Luteolibacter yonseiensis TaxID=1144680 RepID=A0A934VDK6_9BACT|nr:response regulator [Luteolibacter yonseiensis]MBK1817659.1 response regulator [Luteolibacter yonseiensis]
MDYFIFLIGLFLLTAGVGSLFLYREDPLPMRWPLFAAALGILGLKVWSDILVFAYAPKEWLALTDASLGAGYATALLGVCLSPLTSGRRWLFAVKWMAMVMVFVLFFVIGANQGQSAWLHAPVLAMTFAATWKFARRHHASKDRGNRQGVAVILALLLAVVAGVCLQGDLVRISFDTEGQGLSIRRIVMLSAIAGAAACSLAFCVLVWRAIYQRNHLDFTPAILRRRKIGTRMILLAAVFTVVNGAWLAHWLGNQARNEQTSILLSALHLGGDNIDAKEVVRIAGRADEVNGAPFINLRDKLLEIRKALPGSRFVYLLAMRDDRLVFIVDAEDPANKATFSRPGQPVEDYPARWQPELAGQSTFVGPDRDVWGVWFSATVPVWDANQRLVALLGLDYPAAEWLKPVASRRVAAMGVTFSVTLLLVALFVFHLKSIETARRVDHLSERLTDAMTAAEFDTWECFPRPFKLSVGERISSILGIARSDPSLRMLWRQIHPEDRAQLFRYFRLQESPEVEVRLKDTEGRWLWFMLRGRVIHSSPGAPVRLVGTILNIDDRHRSRLEIDRQRQFAQQVMESVPNGLAVVSQEGIITYANPAFVSMARSEGTELVGTSLSSLFENTDFSAHPAGGYETVLTCAIGEPVPVLLYRASIKRNNHDTGFILALVDLTSAKTAERDLFRSRAEANRLALVAKRMDNAVVITNAAGRVEWVNEGFTKISGYTREDMLGKTPGSVLQGATASLTPARAYMRECVKAGKGFETETLNYSKEGRAYIVHIECQPLFDKSGKLTGFMAIERDITQTRRTNLLLEAVATMSSTLLERGIDPSVWGGILQSLGMAANVERCHLSKVHTFEGGCSLHASQIAVWNSTADSPWMQEPELQNRPFEDSDHSRWFHELSAGREICGLIKDFPVCERSLLEKRNVRSVLILPILAAGKLWGFLSFVACHEDKIWEDWEISILRSAAANIGLRQVAQGEADALVLARDEANRAAIVADRANLAKSTFLATMSHEIRTPLNAVIGMASLLETTSLNAQQQDYAQTILSSGNFLLELINDILDYSRIESGHIELDKSPLVLADVCREAFDVIRHGVIGKDTELIGFISPDIPFQFEGDHARIRQILINLLSNAVKFTPGGFVSLEVGGTRAADGRWKLEFVVSDSGIGISEEAIDRLFRPFVQEDSSTTRRFGGSGLGLAISKRLAEVMNGDITIASTPGKGAAFTVTVILNATTADVPALSSPAPFAITPSPRILVVDDNGTSLRIIRENLMRWQLPHDAATSAQEAIRMWGDSGPYDLVLTDQHMPEMDGISMTRHLRSLPGASSTRFALLGTESSLAPPARELFDEVATKPVWPGSLHSMLERLLPGGGTIGPGTVPPAKNVESEWFSDLKVLVAEDNPNNQKVIRLLLKRLGIQPDIVADGLQAVDAASATPYDVILLDLQMPVMDGVQACEAIRSTALPKRPFIVALTANVFQADRDRAAAAGMDEYLSKPITLDRLREMMNHISQSLPPGD